MYYTVPEIALPACDRNERWQVISDCSVQEILINGKCFKSSANIYLVHLEKLDLTSNEKVNMMTSKCGKNCYFNLTIMQLNQDTGTRLHLFVLIALVIHKSYARKYTYRFLSNRVYPSRSNNKLSSLNIRTRIQDTIYKAIEKKEL